MANTNPLIRDLISKLEESMGDIEVMLGGIIVQKSMGMKPKPLMTIIGGSGQKQIIHYHESGFKYILEELNKKYGFDYYYTSKLPEIN